MKTPEPKEVWTEKICSACNGTGFPPVTQPTKPGRKMYPAPCEQRAMFRQGPNKGRLAAPISFAVSRERVALPRGCGSIDPPRWI